MDQAQRGLLAARYPLRIAGMPTPLPINPIPTPVQKLPITPLIGDLLVSETVDTKVAVNATYPDYGTPHPNSAKWPDHKFCWAEPGEKGLQRWVYVADRANQHLYNWEVDTSAERPTVKQTFLIPRDEFEAGNVTYAPPTFLDTDDYQLVATVQSRSDIAKLDNLYVVVQVVWEDTSAIISGQEFDPDTGNLYPYSKEKVPAGTSGDPLNSSGTYSEVQPVNSLWSIKTTKQAAGLAGAASGGVSTRAPYPIVVNYSWPGVLNASNPFSVFYPPLRAGGYGRAIVVPNYLRDAYDGPCVALVYEQWTQTPPTISTVGNAMFPSPITWEGALLQVRIPPTLHQAFPIWETSGTSHPDYKYYYYQQYEPATTPPDWPQYIDSKVDIRPYFGGYLSRRIRIYNPYYTNLNTLIVASVLNVTDTTIQLAWVTGASGTASVYIKLASAGSWSSPTATGLTGNDYTFTGLTANTAYQMKVVIGALTSNTVPTTTDFGVPVITVGPFIATLLEDAAMTPIDYDATGGAIVFSATGLLAGLSINSTTGVVSGTPTPDLSSSTQATISASNDAGSVSQVLTQNYTAKPTVTASQSFALLESETGVSFTIVANNSPTTWSQSTVSSTPSAGTGFFTQHPSLSFSTSTGVISGNANSDTTSRVWVLNITASNAAGDRGAVPITINYTAKPTITAAQSFSRSHNASPIADIQILASNSPTSWTYDGTVSRPASPTNNDFFLAETSLSFDTDTGIISGSTNNHSQNIGTWVLQFTAYNAAGNRGSVNVTIILT